MVFFVFVYNDTFDTHLRTLSILCEKVRFNTVDISILSTLSIHSLLSCFYAPCTEVAHHPTPRSPRPANRIQRMNGIKSLEVIWQEYQ